MEGPNAVAIIGVGCHFPGAENVHEFWKVLVNGEDHIMKIPKSRWNSEAYYDPDVNAPGKTCVEGAGFVKRHKEWDNQLYGITDEEAYKMDPQQRFVLDCVYMAMENAGIPVSSFRGTKTGVYLGNMNTDYRDITTTDWNQLDCSLLTGTSTSFISSRVSYVFDLKGPSLVLDSACSSSLVAIHMALQALKTGEIEMAVCGGVNCILTPDIFIPLSKARMASPTSKCHTFTDQADGYARGEGCGIIILKRLPEAEKDRNHIWATMVTSCNQDGSTVSPITAPSGKQQKALIRNVFSLYNIDPFDITYVEAHGTGTLAGDPVEFRSLSEYFNEFKIKRRYIGSVKTNIGHLESAAGVAGLIKVILMMKYNKIVPSLHFKDNPNPALKMESSNFVVPTSTFDWPRDMKKLCCVNSFSFGGTNAHAVLKDYSTETKDVVTDIRAYVTCFSGKTINSLYGSIKTTSKELKSSDDNLASVSYTSTCLREHYSTRFAVVSTSITELCNSLNSVKKSDLHCADQRPKRIIFAFCAEGRSYPGMCLESMESNKTFLDKLNEIDFRLSSYTGWSLVERLRNNDNLLDPMLEPIATVATQIAQAEVWKQCGIVADAVVGQSIGEVSAAYVSGNLSLEETVKLLYVRTYLMSEADDRKMLAIHDCPVNAVEEIMAKYNGQANIAVYHSTMSCLVSGNPNIMDRIKTDLKQLEQKQNLKSVLKELSVPRAHQSSNVEKMAIALSNKLSGLAKNSSKTIPFYSTVTGNLLPSENLITAKYWAQNICQPVLLSQTIFNAAMKELFNIYIEVGPHPFLRDYLPDILPSDVATALPSFHNKKETPIILNTLSILYQKGINLTWQSMYPTFPNIAEFPRYYFDCKNQLFIPTVRKMQLDGLEYIHKVHPFIRKLCNEDKSRYKMVINSHTVPFAYQHTLSDIVVMQGTTYLEVAMQIGSELFGNFSNFYVSVQFKKPFAPKINTTDVIDIDVKPTHDTESSFRFSAKQNNITYARGSIKKHGHDFKNYRDIQFDIPLIKSRCVKNLSGEELYEILQTMGFSYGKDLKLLGSVFFNDEEALSYMNANTSLTNSGNGSIILHPVIIDGALHASCPIEGKKNLEDIEINDTTQMGFLSDEITPPRNAGDTVTQVIPSSVDKLTLVRQLETEMLVYARKNGHEETKHYFDIFLLTLDGKVILEMKNYSIQRLNSKEKESSIMQEVQWKYISPLPVSVNAWDNEETVKYLLISNDQSIFEVFRGMFKSESLITYNMFTDVNEMTPEDLQNHLLHLVTEQQIGAILFYPNYFTNSVVMLDASEVHNRVLEQCIALKEIGSVIIEKSLPVSVYIFTENTQSICNTEKTQPTNIFGLPLWGMVRSLLKESSSATVKLIDLCQRTKDIVPCIPKVLKLCLKDYLSKYSEIVLSKDSIYSNEIYPKYQRRGEHSFRWNFYDDQCSLQLHASSMEMEHFYFSYQGRSILQSLPDTYMVLRVEYVCLDRCSVIQDSVEATNVNFEIIGREFVGTEEIQRNGARSSGERFVVLQSAMAASYVPVLRVCARPLKDIPDYIPGCIGSCFTLWLMAKEAKKHRDCTILIDENTKEEAPVLRAILKSFGIRKVNIVFFQSLSNVSKFNFTCLIVLMYLHSDDLLLLDSVVRKGKQIILLDSLLESRENLFRLNLMKPDMRILSEGEMFTKGTVSSSLVQLYKWIHKHTNIYLTYIKKKRETIIKLQPPCENPRFQKEVSLSYESNEISCQGPIVIMFQDFSFEDTELKKTIPVKCSKTQLFRQNAVYIVVGGLTGLGWSIVSLLSSRGAGCIATLSRRTATEENVAEMEKLEAEFNTRLLHVQADVTDLNALISALDLIEHTYKDMPVKGIFFGAAILEDGFLFLIDKQKFSKVTAPKIQGAWNFHLVSLKYCLDYFVMHSSITSIIGNIGQTSYGAGNSFMDGLAHYRRQLGLPGQSINWGALEIGMAVEDEKVIDNLKSQGIYFLKKEQIEKCFLDALLCNDPQTIYSKFEWSVISNHIANSESYSQIRHRYSTIISELVSTNEIDFNPNSGTLSCSLNIELLLKMSPEDRREALTEYLFHLISQVVVVEENSLNLDLDLLELGMDSMLAITLVTQIQTDTLCAVPVIALLSGNATLQTLLDHIENKIDYEELSKRFQCMEKQYCKDDALNSISHMEYFVYREYEKHPDNLSLNGYFHFEIQKEIANTQVWEEIMQLTVNMYKNLRVLYISSGEKASKENIHKMILPENSPVNFIVLEGSKDEILHSLDQETRKPFCLSTDPPIRSIFTKQLDVPFLRIILHNICFDIKTFEAMVIDIAKAGIHLFKKNDAPLTPHGDTLLNSATETEKLISDQLDRLQEFWELQIPENLPVSSFVNDLNVIVPSPFKTLVQILPPGICQGINKISLEAGVTSFQIITLLYQLLIHWFTGNEIVMITSPVDLRMHVPRLRNSAWRCVNIIPLITYFTDLEQTIKSFFRINSKRQRDCINHSLYPSNLIEELGKNVNMTSHYSRHKIIQDNLGLLKNTKMKLLELGFGVDFKEHKFVETVSETVLSIQTGDKKNNMNLEFIYNSNLINDSFGKHIFASFLNLIDIVGNDITSTLSAVLSEVKDREGNPFQIDKNEENMHSEIMSTNIQNTANESGSYHVDNTSCDHKTQTSLYTYAEGYFEKRTRKGWKHQRYVALQLFENGDLAIAWGPKPDEFVKYVPLKSVRTFGVTDFNSRSALVFMTKLRSYVFESDDEYLLGKWMYLLNSFQK